MRFNGLKKNTVISHFSTENGNSVFSIRLYP